MNTQKVFNQSAWKAKTHRFTNVNEDEKTDYWFIAFSQYLRRCDWNSRSIWAANEMSGKSRSGPHSNKWIAILLGIVCSSPSASFLDLKSNFEVEKSKTDKKDKQNDKRNVIRRQMLAKPSKTLMGSLLINQLTEERESEREIPNRSNQKKSEPTENSS